MLNRIVLIGRLTRDPELRYTSNGTPVCNFTLAVERNYTNRNGDRDVDFINIVTWRGLAENCARHLGKGRLVGVDGSLQIRKSENNNRTYINPEVNADNVRFLDFGNNSSRSNNQDQNKNDNQQKNNKSAQQNKKQEQDDFDAQFDDNFDADDFDVPF
ncbi:single-stranded DNA-binding protein [Halanaerobium congolense]|uniref:Single-stranded DNA-binding protein n=1 Tax=Halanaerobium congolense TaxID=54121 RepID=A0A1G6IM35_9FIRM|nr:single-stranded DNA-binding protein [Halanaerobium congolense]OEG62468.1 MAG: single-stranded DNA-binding protein [Halanaerobium sp. MDAL1]PTX15930.1 single-strand DNA-binding protein [Halanaerobium congolense]TDS33873.1 single-strand DNA-binding protein [Halanaerobium congolense]TDX44459.1 single-strand DNA-binding protein [Halanaerobium congolense]SDC07547.1 single-strand binding protein [Halanaerobium congolense]